MIGLLQGLVHGVGAEDCLINVGGVGYVVSASARTLSRLPARGEAVELLIETIVREDSFRLFGFLSEEERAWFVRLQSIQGVGAKVALAILDVLPPGDLMAAAAVEDKTAFARANGVGPKLAGRIAMELKDKPAPATRYGAALSIAATPSVAMPTTSSGEASDGAPQRDASLQTRHEAVQALTQLGIDAESARRHVQAVADERGDAPLNEVIKLALKRIGAA